MTIIEYKLEKNMNFMGFFKNMIYTFPNMKKRIFSVKIKSPKEK